MNFVLLGKTGDGKSTFGNRICGDTSKYGDQGEFAASNRTASGNITHISPSPFSLFLNMFFAVIYAVTKDINYVVTDAPFETKRRSSGLIVHFL